MKINAVNGSNFNAFSQIEPSNIPTGHREEEFPGGIDLAVFAKKCQMVSLIRPVSPT